MKSIRSLSAHAGSWRGGTRLLAAGAVIAGVAVLTSALPAGAATPAPRPPASAKRVPMTLAHAKSGVRPKGVGITPGDCGLAIFWVNASSHNFSIDLQSYDGDITGGWYTV